MSDKLVLPPKDLDLSQAFSVRSDQPAAVDRGAEFMERLHEYLNARCKVTEDAVKHAMLEQARIVDASARELADNINEQLNDFDARMIETNQNVMDVESVLHAALMLFLLNEKLPADAPERAMYGKILKEFLTRNSKLTIETKDEEVR